MNQLDRDINEIQNESHGDLSAPIQRVLAALESYRKLDRQAATYVETLIATRTGFTGDPPYVGWKGLGLALEEALNERDRLKKSLIETKVQLDDYRFMADYYQSQVQACIRRDSDLYKDNT